jgi:hypothetical protein
MKKSMFLYGALVVSCMVHHSDAMNWFYSSKKELLSSDDLAKKLLEKKYPLKPNEKRDNFIKYLKGVQASTQSLSDELKKYVMPVLMCNIVKTTDKNGESKEIQNNLEIIYYTGLKDVHTRDLSVPSFIILCQSGDLFKKYVHSKALEDKKLEIKDPKTGKAKQIIVSSEEISYKNLNQVMHEENNEERYNSIEAQWHQDLQDSFKEYHQIQWTDALDNIENIKRQGIDKKYYDKKIIRGKLIGHYAEFDRIIDSLCTAYTDGACSWEDYKEFVTAAFAMSKVSTNDIVRRKNGLKKVAQYMDLLESIVQEYNAFWLTPAEVFCKSADALQHMKCRDDLQCLYYDFSLLLKKQRAQYLTTEEFVKNNKAAIATSKKRNFYYDFALLLKKQRAQSLTAAELKDFVKDNEKVLIASKKRMLENNRKQEIKH